VVQEMIGEPWSEVSCREWDVVWYREWGVVR